MRVRFEVIPYVLNFRFDAGTSRGILKEKPTWFIKAWQPENPAIIGWGEASPLNGLSMDFSADYGKKLRAVLDHLEGLSIPDEHLLDFITEHTPVDMPSVRFGIETCLLDLVNGGQRMIFDNDFFQGERKLPINGLVWMGNPEFMQRQMNEKLKQGFNTIKMKVGAIDFDTELDLLRQLRQSYTSDELTLRVDANGAFGEDDVFEKLEELAALDIHSIEQPIKPGNVGLMNKVAKESLVPIALDEELIGVNTLAEREALLSSIRPQFIVLKPSLVGGVSACKEWIKVAESLDIGWWITSMLESNVGLNAIAQFTAEYDQLLPQGLGTGQLYFNNISSPLTIKKGHLHYFSRTEWRLTL